ncbi:FAD-binding oxidoreductase [Streptomyces hainanensis]|uniref:FAD-binding oxidoreductase n=1 Tax=Streptomyces hainanensis TaxID=402648 RepID=A0A4R4TR65_9ACTN|nr:FAD-binding protein [Streptomyces hainanensis]TDC77882.1 FAD-binding oxidoreductase [Streptomyces hainanensis]
MPDIAFSEVTREDPRYGSLVARSRNTRFVGTPSRVLVPRHAEGARQAVAQAVRRGERLAVRGGGHGLEGLVDDPGVTTVIDVSALDDVAYDPRRGAFAVGAGALMGDVYRSMYLKWGLALPAGTCPSVGLGGYVQGGGFGALCRRHGLVVDHLEAVEVVVADEGAGARTVVAGRDPADPHHDLWWAHTGAGGGNFGVVTRFWFRTDDAAGRRPEDLLPRPPATVLFASATWDWDDLTERDLLRLVANHGVWHAKEQADDSAYESLYSALYLNQRRVGRLVLNAQIDGGRPDARRLLEEYVEAVGEGVRASRTTSWQRLPWLQATARDVENRGGLTRSKSKGAYLRQPFDDGDGSLIHRYLADADYSGHTTIVLFSYGRAVNTVDPEATVVAQRDSLFKCYLGTYWADGREDATHVDRIRRLYRDLFARTGGVPASGDRTDGSYINYPDVDLRDPRWNSSGVPWHDLYFKSNYPRLQRVKARWDPQDVFRHALSVELPG